MTRLPCGSRVVHGTTPCDQLFETIMIKITFVGSGKEPWAAHAGEAEHPGSLRGQ